MPSNAGFSFELTGVKELMNALEQLPTVSMQKTAVRNALKKAALPVLEMAKANVPRAATGNLANSLKISTSLKASQRRGRISDRSRVTVYVGSSAPHAHLIEFGTVERTTKSKGGRGNMSPNPFLRNAWDTMKFAALDILAVELRKQIYAAARRLAKRAGTGKLTTAQTAGLLEQFEVAD